MKRIVEIVPARPGWYARWRGASDVTRSYPVTIWALVEDSADDSREVIGIDVLGQWPGGDDIEDDAVFVRYLFHAPGDGEPGDALPDVDPIGAAERPRPVSAT
ncbi:hypothetical protein [Plantactinospora sp. GCM10030261]|uniref:hypothetical protein n=1 Tax=Plantactinospora sp. GCM10030261 TaxID=3273420 RepID=UPI00361131EF